MRSAISAGAAAAVLVAAGIWLVRASSPEAPPAATPTAAATRREDAAPARAARTAAPAAPAAPSPGRAPAPSPGLTEDLASADPKIRRAAVSEVARAGNPDVGVLLAASRDVDVDVSMAATAALARLYAEGKVPVAEMAERATDRSRNHRLRAASLDAFGAVPSPEAATLLAGLIASGDELERRTAAALLVLQDAELAIPALIGALADPDAYVRGQALDSLRVRARGRDFAYDVAAWRAWWSATSRP